MSTAAASFTVAICTLNRADLLALCLEALAVALQRAPAPVLVVDNGSKDHTREVCGRFAGTLDLRVVGEEQLGLSHAKNRAVAECETDYVVYLDDDAKPLPHWAEAIRDGIARWQPDVFGGPFRPFYLTEKPAWFREEYGSELVGKKEGPLHAPYFLCGGNSGWRVSVLRELGLFPTDLGMRGTQIGVGEETEPQRRLREAGARDRLVFLPRMEMEHYVPPWKMQLKTHLRRAWVTGQSRGRVLGASEERRRPSLAKSLFWCAALVPGTLRRHRDRYPHWQNYVYEVGADRVRDLGGAWP